MTAANCSATTVSFLCFVSFFFSPFVSLGRVSSRPVSRTYLVVCVDAEEPRRFGVGRLTGAAQPLKARWGDGGCRGRSYTIYIYVYIYIRFYGRQEGHLVLTDSSW